MTNLTPIPATTTEKAKAWDRLMSHTGTDAEALQDAWEYLNLTVSARALKPQKTKQSAAMKRFLAEKFPTHCGTSPESEYTRVMGRYPIEAVDVTFEHNGNVIHANDPKGIKTVNQYLKAAAIQ